MQRVRLILPHLREAGIEAEVLAVEAEQVAAPRDPWLVSGLPGEVPVHRVRALGLKWGRIPGLGILSFRALGALRRKGDELLRNGAFDLVYFSTTQFGIHVLGPRWKKRHGVPFVMDYQDPWVSDYYREHPEVPPPGGRLKHEISRWISCRDEPRVLRECSGITSVSDGYPRQLVSRYDFLQMDDGWRSKAEDRVATRSQKIPSLIVPFPGDERDFERVRSEGIVQRVFNPGDGCRHWVYVGRGGKDMETAVRSLFRSLKRSRDHEGPIPENLRIHFIGTSYAGAGRGVKSIEPIAREEGLGDVVIEHPDRIPYSETLRCLLDADALIVPGSNDPAYTASKIYPYLLAGKPMLAVFHEQSSVVSLMRSVGGGVVVAFKTEEEGGGIELIAERISVSWLQSRRYESRVPLDSERFAPYRASEQALRLAEFFRAILNARGITRN